MNEGSIVLYLTKKGLAAVEIYEDLVATVGLEVISYPSVMGYLREAKFATLNPEVTFSQPIREHDDCDNAFLLALDEQPFASICQLARLTHRPRTIVLRRLLQSLGFQVRHLQWVLHRLWDARTSNRLELSRTLLSPLRAQQGTQWHDSITLDESSFYLNPYRESIRGFRDGSVTRADIARSHVPNDLGLAT